MPFQRSTPQDRAPSSRLPGGTSPPPGWQPRPAKGTHEAHNSLGPQSAEAPVPCPRSAGVQLDNPVCPFGSPPTHGAESALLRPTCPSWLATPKGCAPASRGPGTAGGTEPASGGPALAHCTPSPGMGKPYITQLSEHTLSPETFQLPSRTSPLRRRPKSAPRERRGPRRGVEPSSSYARRTPAPASHTSPVAPLPFTPRHSSPSSGLN